MVVKYRVALADYQRSWAHVDSALRGIVRDHAGPSLADIYTKVVLINGVYQVQLSRTHGQGALERVANVLAAAEVELAPAIAKLRSHGTLSLAAVADTMTAHTVILLALEALGKEIDPQEPAKIARSFASKYLHFHADIVPIYDSLASNHVARFLSWSDYRQSLRQIQQSAACPPEGDRAYFNYLLQFSLLYEHLCSLMPPGLVSVKGIDQMLWVG
jgi:hypothetical protein